MTIRDYLETRFETALAIDGPFQPHERDDAKDIMWGMINYMR